MFMVFLMVMEPMDEPFYGKKEQDSHECPEEYVDPHLFSFMECFWKKVKEC